jgi:hypothetical protein
MSDIKNLIREANKTTRRGQTIQNVLWGVVVLLVMVSMYMAYVSIDLKSQAEASEQSVIKERDEKSALLNEKSALLIITDSLKTQAEALVLDLKISEENLQGEKDKLEEIKIAYDSVRQVQLELLELNEQGDELWDYAVKENTVQAYADYINIKGLNDEVYQKLNKLFKKVGYVQIQESNGKMLIDPIDVAFGLWTSKSARSIRNGVMGLKGYTSTQRNGDVVLEGQPFIIVKDSIMSGKTRWAEILY